MDNKPVDILEFGRIIGSASRLSSEQNKLQTRAWVWGTAPAMTMSSALISCFTGALLGTEPNLTGIATWIGGGLVSYAAMLPFLTRIVYTQNLQAIRKPTLVLSQYIASGPDLYNIPPHISDTAKELDAVCNDISSKSHIKSKLLTWKYQAAALAVTTTVLVSAPFAAAYTRHYLEQSACDTPTSTRARPLQSAPINKPRIIQI